MMIEVIPRAEIKPASRQRVFFKFQSVAWDIPKFLEASLTPNHLACIVKALLVDI